MQLSKISKEQFGKILKAAAYLAVSSVIASILALIAEDPALFGVLTPIVNIVLVTVKQAFTVSE